MKTYLQFITESSSGLYTFRRLNQQSSEFLYEWMKENRVPNPNSMSELHCTVICSDVEIPGYTVDPALVMLNPATYKIAIMNEALVVQFKSDPLVEQWQKAMNLGGKSKFPTFIPHITLSYKVPEERDHGIQAGFAFREVSDYTVVYTDLGISPGMQLGIDHSHSKSIPAKFRTLPGWGKDEASTK